MNVPFDRVKSKIQFPSKLKRFINADMRPAGRVAVTAPSSTPGQANTLEASSPRLDDSVPTTLLAVQ